VSADITVIPLHTQPRVRWANGLGWTTEILARPAGAGNINNYDYRLSVAEVDVDCAFSSLPGLDRTILVLTGPGFDLTVGDDPPVHLTRGAAPFAFSGDRPAACRVAGPTRDFNVMTRRGRYLHTVARHALRAPLVVPRPADTAVALYLVAGAASLAGRAIAPGDCLLLEPVPGASPALTLETAAADLVLVTLTGLPAIG
jgi:environmental stress-induced protein Ves